MEFEGEGYEALKMDDSLISIESSFRVHDLRLPRRDADLRLFLTCSSSLLSLSSQALIPLHPGSSFPGVLLSPYLLQHVGIMH